VPLNVLIVAVGLTLTGAWDLIQPAQVPVYLLSLILACSSCST
jgi:hypothetical protein